ncbi:nitrate- and nitrite sensing domain-containing protein [Yinghuangia sp. ASG 101]|uniref:sensor histidine kinase n=1 Tax=Yinghuangia sp. ASG 101 TaxID=2896848 RepID=UPI001E4CA1CC|nr:nitrate- and nitrite sensing domain-containing protein [Yinghuangia sp. ASG 101]UGQ11647.1 nitrate- and nitrite sensing domain-containing protein [Yinghuangia sp. ASG 101]
MRSLRARIVVLVLVPGIALGSLWTTFTVSRYHQAQDLRQTVHDVQRVGVKSEIAMVAMQEERRLTMEYLARGTDDAGALANQRQRTDQALAAMRDAAGPVVAGNPPDLKRIFGDITAGLAQLPAFRQQVDVRGVDTDAAFAFYTGALTIGMSYFEAEAGLTDDTKSANEGGTAAALFRALEYLSRQNAVLSAALASPTGWTPEQRTQFDQLVGAQRGQWTFVSPRLRGDQAARYAEIVASPEWARLTAAENAASTRTGRPPIDAAAWQATMPVIAEQLQQLTLDQVTFAVGYAEGRADDLMASVILVGALTLAALALAVLVSVLVSRSLINRLRGLRDSTRRLANEQLPDLVTRLKQGEKVDPGEFAPDFAHGDDEIGEVARAFDEAQRTAVSAAVEQAETREGISRVFLNLAHRSQGLVHRQLALLDGLEREHEDPDLLAELFRVDHLATRMRRNAENLSVLGGTMPARRWRRPVPLVEILRGAASQTEDYSRVTLTMIPDGGLAGPVAGDVMHLLSELVENATSFSPPHTKVRIHAEVVPNGLGIEIEDRGLGMSEESRAEANELLATAPEFNVMGFTRDSRIGLFVVARLAERHGIAVSLRSSPYGGTSAVVLVPPALIVHADDEPGETSDRPMLVEALPAGGAAPERRAVPVGAAPDRAHTHPAPDVRTAPPPVRRIREEPPEPARLTAVRPAATPPAAPPVRPAAPNAASGPGGTPPAAPPPDERRRLPRRIRQASLRPQLLNPPAPEAPGADTAVEHRPAEEARTMMAAFQRGSFKGRTDAGGGPHAPDADAPEPPNGQGQW